MENIICTIDGIFQLRRKDVFYVSILSNIKALVSILKRLYRITKTRPCNIQIFVKIENFQFLIFFSHFCSKHRLLVLVRTACRGGSNEYPQSMFWSKNKNNRYTPANPGFALY